jgi:hypothetical protein
MTNHDNQHFDSFPRVLVVARDPFNTESHTGITLSNLFRGWPNERLMGIHWGQSIKPDLSIFSNQLRLPPKGLCKALLRVKRSIFSEKNLNSDIVAANKFREIGAQSLYRCWIQATNVGLNHWAFAWSIPREVRNAIKIFQPQLLYAVLIPEQIIFDVIDKRPDYTNLMVHIFDDWISVPQSMPFGELYYSRIQKKLISTFSDANVRIAIGEEMSRTYEIRYGQSFSWIQNAPDENFWMNFKNKGSKHETRFIFRSIGSIYPGGNIEAIERFARVLEEIGDMKLRPILEMYVPKQSEQAIKKRMSCFSRVFIYPLPIQDEDVARIYQSSDAVLLAYNGNQYALKWLGLSMPTKLPICLLTSTPIFVFAPGNAAITKFIISRQCGYVSESGISDSGLKHAIRGFILDKEKAISCATTGLLVGQRELSASVMKTRFWRIITENVSPYKVK